MHLDDYYLGKIPLPKKSKQSDEFKTLYHNLEKAQKNQDTLQVSKIDSNINSLIYEVYDLNETEINLIESDFVEEKSRNYSENIIKV